MEKPVTAEFDVKRRSVTGSGATYYMVGGDDSIGYGGVVSLLAPVTLGDRARVKVTVEVLSQGVWGYDPWGWAAARKSLSPGRGVKGLVVHQRGRHVGNAMTGSYVALCNGTTKLGYTSAASGGRQCKRCLTKCEELL